MARDAVIQVRVSQELKRDVDALFDRLGIDTTAAIRLFLKQSLLSESIPFRVKAYYNKEDKEAREPLQEVYLKPNGPDSFAESPSREADQSVQSDSGDGISTGQKPEAQRPFINDYFDD